MRGESGGGTSRLSGGLATKGSGDGYSFASSRARGPAFVVGAALLALGAFQVASASATSCIFNATTRQATATIDPGTSASAVVVGSDTLRVGADAMSWRDHDQHGFDSRRRATARMRLSRSMSAAGCSRPGFSADGTLAEIEFSVELGDATDT